MPGLRGGIGESAAPAISVEQQVFTEGPLHHTSSGGSSIRGSQRAERPAADLSLFAALAWESYPWMVVGADHVVRMRRVAGMLQRNLFSLLSLALSISVGDE